MTTFIEIPGIGVVPLELVNILINYALSGIMAILGLLAHNLLKMATNPDQTFVITLPTIENGKLRIGGSISSLVFAFIAGVILLDPKIAFLTGFAGAQALKDVLVWFENKKKGLLPLF